ncbi:MAG: hypothetical protein OXH36_02975 [Bdellovibrionales bacterium]|nr:hypothetical protein [Bdellovibrionales bacterium]
MYNFFMLLIFVFGVNARADISAEGIFLTCDQLNGLHYLGGCCAYSNEERAYVSNKTRWLSWLSPFSGEREYSRWQRQHIRGWYPPEVRNHNFFLYVKKEDVPWFNPNIKLKIKKCYHADWKKVNYYGIPLLPIPTGKAHVTKKVPCNQPYANPPLTCQQAADSLPSEIFNP